MESTTVSLSPPVCRLSGRLTFKDNDAFTRLITDLIAAAGPEVALDLSDLDFIDSFGIGLFLTAAEQFEGAGKLLTLKNPRGPVKRLFKLAQLDSVLRIRDDSESAAATMAVSVETQQRDGLCVTPPTTSGDGHFSVSLSGRFTFADQGRFQDVLTLAESENCQSLTLDMSELAFMDSAGLSMILVAHEVMTKRKARLVLQSPKAKVAHLLSVAAVDDILPVVQAPDA
jgi:anti-anti-sigma factor